MKRTVEMQMDPGSSKLRPLIDVNSDLAAGPVGRG
jgi:hypothetical protein